MKYEDEERLNNFIRETERYPYFSTLYDMDQWKEDLHWIKSAFDSLEKLSAKTIGQFVKGDTLLEAEHIRIIVDNKCHEIWQVFDQYTPYKEITLNDCLKIAKEKLGYKDAGIILVLNETYLRGEIYRYGNYPNCDEWEIAGKMHGFA